MRILFDQGTPVGIRDVLLTHEVKTAAEQGWSSLSNGHLLNAAEQAGFDVLLTTDTNIRFQQNLTGRRIAIVALSPNRWTLIRTRLSEVVAAVEEVRPGGDPTGSALRSDKNIRRREVDELLRRC
jgi:hypothetical protein